MNSFGRIFRVHIFGESHGPAVGVVIDGCPPGIALREEDFTEDLRRRQGGQGIGTTPRKETDEPIIQSGLFNGFTTGAPLTILFQNSNTRSQDYEAMRAIPRPGHADFVAGKKFGGFQDHRGGGHFSGRLTVCLVAAGVVAKKVLGAEVQISAHVAELGGITDIPKALEDALAANDSIGGIVACRVSGLPVGLGEPFWDAAESLLAHTVFAIPAVRGIEFGAGFAATLMKGSEHNDGLEDDSGKTHTNHAGGIVGGLTNGNEVVFRIAVKPASSTPQQQQSLNVASGRQETFSIGGRHDLAIALRVPPVLEAVAAIVFADLKLIGGF